MSAHHLLPRFNAWTLTYILLITGIITLGANHDHTDSQGKLMPNMDHAVAAYFLASINLEIRMSMTLRG